jgi:hypothetical protein
MLVHKPGAQGDGFGETSGIYVAPVRSVFG